MRSGRINLASGSFDGVAALIAVWVASDLRWISEVSSLSTIRWPAPSWFLAFILLWILVCDRMQLNVFYPFRSELMSRVVVANVLAGCGALGITVVFGAPLAGFGIVTFVLGFFCLVGATRVARHTISVRNRLGPDKRRRVVIVGGDALARELASALQRGPASRYQVVGFLAPEMEEVAGVSADLTMEATVATVGVAEYLAAKKVHEVFFTLPNSSDPDVLKLVTECRESGIVVSFVPHGYQLFITRSVLRNVGGIPLVTVDGRQVKEKIPRMKTIADTVVAIFLLLITSPLIGIAACVLVRMRGSAFRRESRCGVAGLPFQMYRFNIERGENANWLDRSLDITKISELPQLLNVVRGEMSLIGPQAESAQRVQHFPEWQKQSLRFRPGVTGYAQLYGLRGPGNMAERARYDIQYSFRWAPLLEMTLIVQTFWFVVRRVARALLLSPFPRIGKNPLHTTLEVAGVNRSQPSTD